MPLIEPGRKAPAFTLKDQEGQPHALADYLGRPVVLYFYPKDDTPGCTAESCSFQDNLPKFKAGKASVVGVSIALSIVKLSGSTANAFRSSAIFSAK